MLFIPLKWHGKDYYFVILQFLAHLYLYFLIHILITMRPYLVQTTEFLQLYLTRETKW